MIIDIFKPEFPELQYGNCLPLAQLIEKTVDLPLKVVFIAARSIEKACAAISYSDFVETNTVVKLN